jgi:hypothetical protein
MTEMTEQSGSVMRLRGRMLATPVLWYRHANTNRTLVLILNNHIGAAEYWAAMRQRISELEAAGAVVRWEGVTAAPEQEWAGATDADRAARAVIMDLFRDRPAAIAAHLGWVTQKAGLPIGENWEHADLTDLDFIRATGPAAVLTLGAAVAAGQARLGTHRERYEAVTTPLTLRALARPHARLSAAIASLGPPEFSAVQVAGRSKLAAAVDPGRNTVIIYGAEHADTIDAELAAAGWARTGKCRWLTVGQLPPLARSMASVLAVAWGIGVDTFRGLRSGEIDADLAWAEVKARHRRT